MPEMRLKQTCRRVVGVTAACRKYFVSNACVVGCLSIHRRLLTGLFLSLSSRSAAQTRSRPTDVCSQDKRKINFFVSSFVVRPKKWPKSTRVCSLNPARSNPVSRYAHFLHFVHSRSGIIPLTDRRMFLIRIPTDRSPCAVCFLSTQNVTHSTRHAPR